MNGVSFWIPDLVPKKVTPAPAPERIHILHSENLKPKKESYVVLILAKIGLTLSPEKLRHNHRLH